MNFLFASPRKKKSPKPQKVPNYWATTPALRSSHALYYLLVCIT